MKRKVWIGLIITACLFIGVAVASSFLNDTDVIIYGLISSLFFLYLSIYLFGGLAKLIIFFIYGFLAAILLRIAPDRFDVIVIFIFTLVFVLNPLANFEAYLNDKLSVDELEPLKIEVKGLYQTFYRYRREMKNYYHLPQTRKLYVKPWYKTSRQLASLGLFAVIVFLLLYTTKDIFDLKTIRAANVLTLYIISILYVMLILVHKKGFTTMLRSVKLTIFVPMIYFVLTVPSISNMIRIILVIGISLFELSMIIYELVTYYTRVSYQAYKYEDKVRKELVFANALYEPFVYNETYTEIADYGIEVSLNQFEDHFKEILIYANYHRFIITAYTYDANFVHIFTEFNKRQEKRQDKFQMFLSSIFKTHVGIRQSSDLVKKFYEQRFFHNHEYIVARALSLAKLLNELEIKSEIIISIVFYFNAKKDAKAFQRKYPSTRLREIEENGLIALQTSIKAINFDYIIENNVRDVLLESMIHKGTYVRIMLYY